MKTFLIFRIARKCFIIAFLIFSVGANAQQTEFVAATWLDNNREENLNNFYALHKHAPIGTIIQVSNPVNNRTANVIVIAKLPDSRENKGIVIKLSGAAARYLDVLDKKNSVGLTMQQTRKGLQDSKEKAVCMF